MKPRYSTPAEREAAPCYIARHTPTCGLIVGAFVADDPDRAEDIAKEVAEWIRAGDVVTRGTVSEVRAQEWCKCFIAQQSVQQSDSAILLTERELEARGQTNMLAP